MPTRRPASAPDGRTDARTDGGTRLAAAFLYRFPTPIVFVRIKQHLSHRARVCRGALRAPSARPAGARLLGQSARLGGGAGRGGPPGQRPGGGRRSAEVPQSASGSLPDFAFAFWRLWITSVLPKTASKIRPKVSPHRIILLVTFRFKLICTTGFAFPLIKKNKGDGGVTGHAFLVWPLDVLCNYKAGKELIVLRRQARNS